MLGLALAIGEPWPGMTTVLLSGFAGLCAIAGLLALYGGLAVGRMGVVAPVAAVIAAILPVMVGFVRLGLPGIGVIAGIGCALVAVVLVSRSPDATGRRSGIEYAIVAGIAIGLFNVAVGAFPEDRILWPLAIIRAVALVGAVAIVVFARRPWRVPRPLWPAVLAVAVLDLAGNGFYILATQAGRLDVAATLSSLYPVTTILLAIALLHERVSRSHLAGIIMAVLAIALIAGGSAAPA
jgi:drug/metabolite transporter (DMT)-like permease